MKRIKNLRPYLPIYNKNWEPLWTRCLSNDELKLLMNEKKAEVAFSDLSNYKVFAKTKIELIVV